MKTKIFKVVKSETVQIGRNTFGPISLTKSGVNALIQKGYKVILLNELTKIDLLDGALIMQLGGDYQIYGDGYYTTRIFRWKNLNFEMKQSFGESLKSPATIAIGDLENDMESNIPQCKQIQRTSKLLENYRNEDFDTSANTSSAE